MDGSGEVPLRHRRLIEESKKALRGLTAAFIRARLLPGSAGAFICTPL
jgi:hypothetical protein